MVNLDKLAKRADALNQASDKQANDLKQRLVETMAEKDRLAARNAELAAKLSDAQRLFHSKIADLEKNLANAQQSGGSPDAQTAAGQRRAYQADLNAAIQNALKSGFGKGSDSSATLDGAMRNTAEGALFGKEVVEACERLKDRIDTQMVTLMNMMNKSLDIGVDGRAYSNDPQQDKIVANPTSADLISSFRNTEHVTRELAEVVKDMPREIETLFQMLDDSHAEFISLITGQKYQAPKRVFPDTPKVDSASYPAQPARTPSSVEASLQTALSQSADRAEFLQTLVEASKRLKEKIDARVVVVLTMMNEALSRGVDDIAYGFDGANNQMIALPQPNLVVGFAKTEEVARELETTVADLPKNIQALLKELMEADAEFNDLISQRLTK